MMMIFFRQIYVKQLREHGYDVTEAANGKEAISLMQGDLEFPFCAVITDLMMPEVTGDQLISQIRMRCSCEPLMILMSAMPNIEEIVYRYNQRNQNFPPIHGYPKSMPDELLSFLESLWGQDSEKISA